MALIDAQKDYYAILGVTPDADDEAIKQAYRQGAREYHPDSGHGDVERFRQIQEAYEVLRDKALRLAYDRQRERRGLSENAPVVLELLQSRTTLAPLDVSQVVYVLVDIRPHSEQETASIRQHLNMALVVDCSTSMSGARIQNVKIAAADLLENLAPTDRLALITFNDRAEVLAPSELVENARNFKSAIASMIPGGGTEIYQGLLAGLNEVKRYAAADMVNHVILLTDGRTYGDELQSLREARQAASEGITISAFGIGEDWNDEFLDELARNGGGVSHYISSPSEVRTVLKQQIQGLCNIMLQNMKLEVNLAPYVHIRGAYRATPYLEILDFTGNVIKLGSLLLDEPVVVVLELIIEPSAIGERRIVRLDLVGDKAANAESVRLRQDVNVTFTLDVKEEPPPPKLINHLARLAVFQLQERAWKALGAGNVRQATQYLEYAATRLFDMGQRDLGQAAMLEVGRLSHGGDPTKEGRKKLRYGTRGLIAPVH
ncbi:MAG TPA: VWA domain-containing protein [Anaerolineae bacterium]|nr:VWA domain-containing protein [Anaerolineae bacterium]HQI86685.1 VWA domain-containing protein [Anaerolineae bacterium]HQK13425.1 VWA domain-containing protein [Anaerolineae bacterium]